MARRGIRSSLIIMLVLGWGCAAHHPRHVGARAASHEITEAPSAESLAVRVTNAYPSISPDGRKVAYMSNAGRDFEIYVSFLDAARRVQLTNAPGRDGTPVWSPDGSKIAFQSLRDGHSQIYVMDADGSNQRNLSGNEFSDEHPWWSRDGSRILFCSDRTKKGEKDANLDIFEMAADGSDVRQITDTPETETYASWSPDGSKIVCRRVEGDGNWEVVVLDSNGKLLTNLSRHPAPDAWPIWTPDGTKIVFASLRSGASRIYEVSVDGSGLRMVTPPAGRWDDRQPALSPDGRTLFFARYWWFPGAWYEASQIYWIPLPRS